ncbi:hypothetical protein V2J09_005621 [Rumex salicifolius]
MISYTVGLARSLKSDDSYAQALMTLEQYLAFQLQKDRMMLLRILKEWFCLLFPLYFLKGLII